MNKISDTPKGTVFLYPAGPAGLPDAGLRSALRRRGYRTLEPADAVEARSVLPELAADLYLVEAETAADAAEGLAAIAAVRAARDTPVLVIAGPGLPQVEVPSLYAQGAVDVLAFPADGLVEIARIEAILRLQRRLADARELSMRDALTGLYNRRFFFERLEQEIARSMRTRQGLALLLFDVDRFKKVNDTFGHPTGDAVLCAIADAAQKHSRRSDVVARVGGDEFAMLLCSNSATGARICAEGLREKLAATAFDGTADLRVSLSIGIAVYPSTLIYRPIEDLVRLADEAQLRAKALGRDRVVVAGEG